MTLERSVDSPTTVASLLERYDPGDWYDEAFSAPGVLRPHYRALF